MESFGLFVDDGHKLATYWADIKKIKTIAYHYLAIK